MTVLAAPALSPVKKREGNIELLRIVCMLMIIAHHLAYHGVAMHAPLRTNKVLATVLFSGGMTGVNSFVLITGYFLAPFRAKRLVSILLQTLFYSVGLTLLCRWTGWRQDVTDDAVLRSAFVLARSPYWFVTMYTAMTALLPLLQPAVQRLGQRAHAWVLAVAALYLCVIPTLTFQDPASPYFHQLIWFFFQSILSAKLAFLQQPLFRLVSLLRQVFWHFLIRQAEFPFRDQPYRLCSENRNGFTVAARSPAPDQSADRFCYISRQETGLSLRQAA